MDSPNLYQAFGFNPHSLSDPFGLEYGTEPFEMFAQLTPEQRQWMGEGAVQSVVGQYQSMKYLAGVQARGGAVATALVVSSGVLTHTSNRMSQAEARGYTRSLGLLLAVSDQTPLTGFIESALQHEIFGDPLSEEEAFRRLGGATAEFGIEVGVSIIGGGLGRAAAGTRLLAPLRRAPRGGLSRGAQLRQRLGGRYEEYMRFRGQGRPANEAKYLMQPYENGSRMGHHFPITSISARPNNFCKVW